MKPYPLAPNKYLVTSAGEVKSLSRNQGRARHNGGWLKGAIRKDGRKVYLLFINGRRVYKQAHTMVLETYVGPKPSPMHECRHLDGNPLNNCVTNLRWGTSRENAEDRTRHGSQLGEKHGRCLTTTAQVQKLKRLRQEGVPLADAARQVDIPYGRAWAIDRGFNWKHVKAGEAK